MRLIALCALLAALMPPSCCERRNLTSCSNDPGFECPAGQYCELSPGEAIGTCAPLECSSSSDACPTASPLCDRGLCVKCSSNVQCARLDPSAPICDPSGRCYGCESGDDCQDSAKPVCDATAHSCRPCQLHAECASGVCAKDDSFAALPRPIAMGTCVDPSRVWVVDQACTTNMCSPSLPTQLGKVDADHPYVLIKELFLTNRVTVPVTAIQNGLPTYYIIGPMADLPPSKLTSTPPMYFSESGFTQALLISAGAHTILEGILIVNSPTGLECASSGSTQTKVRLIRSFLGSNQTAIVTHPGCELALDSSWIGKGPLPQLGSFGSNVLAMQLDGTKLDIVNSVFWRNGKPPGTFGGIQLSNSVGGTPPRARIINSSFIDQEFSDSLRQTLAIDCQLATSAAMSIGNTLFLNSSAPGMGVHYVHSNCGQFGTVEGVVSNEVDPTLTDGILTGDLHFKDDAPSSVTNGGVLSFSNGLTTPSTDMDGQPRGKSQISPGAFEASR